MASLPPLFVERLHQLFPPHLRREVERSFIARPTSFRINTLLADPEEVLETLKREAFTVKRISWLREGFILTNRSQRELVKQPIYREGKIYLQSLASMLPPLILAPAAGERVLDMTAAPGSKTSQIAAMMRLEGELHAYELDKIRFQRLVHNMKLLGADREGFLHLHQGDAAEDPAMGGRYDKILLDAPCSAEARIVESDRRSFAFWSEQNIFKRAAEQKRLLSAAARLLKPGGTLVYSTCTFAPEENELQLEHAEALGLRSQELRALPTLNWLPGLSEWRGRKLGAASRHGRRIVPAKDIEGFFVARLSMPS